MSYIPPPATLPSGSTVWSYLRDSGGESQGESIDRQRTEIREYCARHGLRLIQEFVDEARSGGSVDGRGDFDRMMDASSKGNHADGLLIWDFARFSRSLDDSGYYKAVLRKNGLVIHSLTDPIPDGPFSRVVEMIIDVANQEKRRQVSRDTQSGLKRIVETYGAMPGPVPTGYKKVEIDAGTRRDGSPHILHKWVPDPEKAPLVLQAFKMRALGSTLKQIKKETRLFSSKNSYTTFFNNSVYKGEMWFSGKTYPCEPIVTLELWEQVQKMGELRSRARYGPQSQRCTASPYLFSGLIYCKECGSPLYGYKLLGTRTYYICSRARRRHDCSARHIPMKPFEAAVVQKVLEDVLTVENLQTMQKAIMESWKEKEELEKQMAGSKKAKLANINKRITRFAKAIGEDGPSRALLDQLHKAEDERDQLESELAQVTPKPVKVKKISLADIAERLRDKLTNGEIQERKAALNQIVQKITAWRDADHIQAEIVYRMPETNNSPKSGGDVSGEVSGPDEISAVLLTIPIRKYALQEVG